MKKTDWAIRDEKNAMLKSVGAIQKRYSYLDDVRYALAQDLPTVEAAIAKYYRELKAPLYKFFAGDVLEQVVGESHDAFITSLKDYIKAGKLTVNAGVSTRLLDSLRTQIMQNIDGLVAGADADMRARAAEFGKVAAESANAAAVSVTQMTQLKIESITRRTTGKEDLQKSWIDLQDKYGTRETVKYRNGANYPLNTYLSQRANTTSADLHVITTQFDASSAGVYTGKISNHGAKDSCSVWEGKIVCFTPEGRDILSKRVPAAAGWKTVDEIKRDKSTHMWKFNCTHGVTPYPIQFFDDKDLKEAIEETA